MKLLNTLLLITTIAFSGASFAHGGGHSSMNADKAVALAQTSAKMLTFKAYDMAVGKLDKSWNKVPKTSFILVEEAQEHFIVKATNNTIKQTLYFSVSKDGSVSDVSESASFEKDHGHQH